MDLSSIFRLCAAKVGLSPAPLAVAYEITHLCNLSCRYCDRHTRRPREMTLAQILSALEQLYELGMRFISLDGGEPLTHPHIDQVVAWLNSRNVRVVMDTNGLLVPAKIQTVRSLARVKISLDGLEETHDAMRGPGAYVKALRGAMAARQAGVEVEFTCVVGTHNENKLEELIEMAVAQGFRIVFQPARHSLFATKEHAGDEWTLDAQRSRAIFTLLQERKRKTRAVGNKWSSLRHLARFPEDTAIPCCAGWIEVTMDPEGNLFHCGQVSRADAAPNVTQLGVKAALAALDRSGCTQCWCARVVQANYAWGCRIDKMLPRIWIGRKLDQRHHGALGAYID